MLRSEIGGFWQSLIWFWQPRAAILLKVEVGRF
jgi:hypothetical protein